MASPLSDAGVTRFLEGLGLPGIVDVHVHFMPKPVMDKVWEYFERGGELIGKPWPIEYRTDEADRLATLRSLGVCRFGCLSYAHKPGMAEWLTNWSLEFANRTPGAIPTGTFFPEPGVEIYVDEAIRSGAELFKVHLQVGGFDPRDPLLRQVWGQLSEANVPVIVHAGSGPIPGSFTGAGPFGEVMKMHPELPAIVAHMGVIDEQEFIPMAARYERMRLDTTMVGTAFMEDQHPFDPGLLPLVQELGLAGKVLFGSDFPNIPYPFSEQINALRRWDLGDDWLRAVLWENGAALFAGAS
jgi:hypothetical protein